jgi:hypothetical protein
LTSLYTFTTIFISIFPWLGENAIGNPLTFNPISLPTLAFLSTYVQEGTCNLLDRWT